MSAQVLGPAAGANRARWDGRARGHYEVWYLTLADPATRRGFWFRYTLEVPKAPARDPVAELWGFAFAPGRPAVGGKHAAPLTWPPAGVVELGEARLEEGRAVGEVGDLAWDLRWQPSPTAFWHLPGRLGRSRVPATRVVSPNLAVRFSGTVRVGGERVELREAPGCQTHLWGRQHAARWAWGHCSAFAEGEAVLEAIYAVPLLGRDRPAPGGLTFLYVEVEGEPLACNAFPWVALSRSRVASPRWEMRGRFRDRRIRAVLEANLGEMAQVTYEDPDGAEAYCVNSEIARAALEVEGPGGAWRRFTSEGLAHVEFGARQPDPRVPVLV